MEEEQPIPLERPGRRYAGRKKRPLDKTALRELTQKQPEEIILRLASKDGGLDEFLNDASVSDAKMTLFLTAIGKCFTPVLRMQFRDNIQDIIGKMLGIDVNFFRELRTFVNSFIGSRRRDDEDMNSVLSSTLTLLCCAMEIFPSFAEDKVFSFEHLLQALAADVADANILEKLQRLKTLLQQHRRGRGHSRSDGVSHPARGMRINQDDEQPVDNFRALPLIPSPQDLISDEQVVLRKNKETGQYQNLEDYLDIQFRLFRADFILPLRESIDKYLGSHEDEQCRGAGAVGGGRGIRVYHDVQIMRPVCTDREISYRLSFDVGRLQSVDWKVTQRLRFGSLLCLSRDNFQNYICAVVQEREPVLLANGLVDVTFILDREEIQQVTASSRDHRFIMVESPAYFEAYRHILQGLKNLNDQNFPFVQYIVNCNPAVNPPAYLQGHKVMYDFRPLLDDDFTIKDQSNEDPLTDLLAEGGDNEREVEVISGRNWPPSEELKLDNSQYTALHHALTREFAIIQGPPGTGKTYLGLKILKMLLHNSQHWNGLIHKRPMLIVCYTNHALDQFLEGILKFFKGTLVRVGARSKSELLKDCSLNNARIRARENRKVPMEVHEAKMRARDELRELRLQIHAGAAKLEIAEQEIVKEFFLESHMQSCIKDFGHQSSPDKERSMMLKWLRLENLHERLVEQAENHLKRLPAFKQSMRKAGQRGHFRDADADDNDDDDDDEEDDTIDITASFRDNHQSRKLEDDDDYDDSDFDVDLDLDLEVEESNAQKTRRLLQQLERETLSLRLEFVALHLSSFSDQEESDLKDKTVARPSKEQNKKVVEDFRRLRQQYKRLLQSQLRSTDRMSQEEAERVTNIWKLSVKDRWRLYRHWVDLYCRQMRGEIREWEEQYHNKAQKYREVLYQEDRIILQNATIIGMTTTGAARYQSVLQAIGPRVIIVEEAAEVFEAHVVTTLSRDCQHLILIGDHKQLRPSPVVFDLAKKCHLDVSLFERMIRNKFQFDCLEYQHRMRPEISGMMKLDELYPKLQDHEVVKHYPAVRGVRHNVFYINHSRPEERDEETKSFSNEFEAKFVVAFCDYLMKQDYQRTQITILTPYSGQIRTLGSLMRKRNFDGVRVSSVDNFQGEENDIILLSLVRSNSERDIGFLKMENRMCVALSRAKMGLYVIGNFENLGEGSSLLQHVVNRAKVQQTIGPGLPLACQNHAREGGIVAKTAEDFQRAPEGGCRKPCNVRLPCGHVCPRVCHPASQGDHERRVCPMPCTAVCPDCGQACREKHACDQHERCTNSVRKQIPRCGHEQMVPCGEDPMHFTCQENCNFFLPCGDRCQAKCGEPHTVHCGEMVTVDDRPCQHQFQAKCSERATAACTEPCSQELVCGHACQGSCGECSQGRLHVACQEKCQKILVCQHDCEATCCQCPPCKKKCQNKCVHSDCDKQCGQSCVSCTMKCVWRCPHKSCTRLCGEPCDRDRCDEPCQERNPDCGHPCIGLCGEVCPPFCRICDEEILKDPEACVIFGEPDEEDRFVFLEDCCHVFEFQALDTWVDRFQPQPPGTDQGAAQAGPGEEAEAAETEHRLVKMPECPRCKTPIRRNLRYGNVVKACLAEIEIIKRRCLGDRNRIDELDRRVEQAKSRLPAELRDRVKATLREGGVKCESLLATQFYQITQAIDTNQLLRQVSNAITRWPDMLEVYRTVQSDLELFIAWTLRSRNVLSGQENFDARQEFQRLRILTHLLHCRHAISEDDIQIEPRIMSRLAATIRILSEGRPLAENEIEEGRKLQEELQNHVPDPYTALTDEEREEIVRAVSLPTGHWYACPRGHYYVVGECGRPLETASCPECHNVIGGENHAVAEGNRWAPEVDEAEGPVWDAQRDLEYALMLQREEWARAGFI